MKKILALLLAAIMCFSLVACGGLETPNTDDNSTQEQQAQNGNDEPEVTDPDISEPDNTETEPENTEPQYVTVEITTTNWQDYFEVEEYYLFRENGFGEFQSLDIYYLLVSKDGFIPDFASCNVTMEYGYDAEEKDFKIDFDNRTVVYSEAVATGANGTAVKTMEELTTVNPSYENRYGLILNRTNTFTDLDKTYNWYTYDNLKVVRVTGNFSFRIED